MQTTDKARLTALINPTVDKKLRIFCAEHGKSLSETAEAMILHCINNRHFIEKLTKKEEAMPDYEM